MSVHAQPRFVEVMDWLDRQVHCPLCGAKLTEGSQKEGFDGDGTIFAVDNIYACGLHMRLRFDGNLLCEKGCASTSAHLVLQKLPAKWRQ